MKKATPKVGPTADRYGEVIDTLSASPGEWYDITDEFSHLNSLESARTTLYQSVGRRFVEVRTEKDKDGKLRVLAVWVKR